MPWPLPLSVGRRQDSFSSLEKNPGLNRKQVPQPAPLQRGPGVATWAMVGGQEEHLSGVRLGVGTAQDCHWVC